MDELRSTLTGGRAEGARWTGVLLVVTVLGAGCSMAGATSHAGDAPPGWTHAFDSAQALGREVLAALRAGDVTRLEQVAVTESEFRQTVWPMLPASRPEVGLPFDYVWGELRQKSRGHLRETLQAWRGLELELLDVDFRGETTEYGDFRVRRDSVLEVRTPSGERKRIRAFGAMIEYHGRVKVFSYVVD